MVKAFDHWVSDMAGSIEDRSEFIKPCSCGGTQRAPRQDVSVSKIRLAFADLLVSRVADEDDLRDWLTAFASGLSYDCAGSRELIQLRYGDVLPHNLVMDYYNALDFAAEYIWFLELRNAIEMGAL